MSKTIPRRYRLLEELLIRDMRVFTLSELQNFPNWTKLTIEKQNRLLQEEGFVLRGQRVGMHTPYYLTEKATRDNLYRVAGSTFTERAEHIAVTPEVMRARASVWINEGLRA